MSSTTPSPARAPVLLHGVPGALLTALVLIAGGTLTGLAWRSSAQAEEQRANDALAMHAGDIQLTIESRLLAHEGLLRAGAGVVGASWPVSAQQWRVFVGQLRLAALYPGARGVGFAALIRSPQDLQYWRDTLEPLGFADRIPGPEPGRPRMQALVVYLEPLDATNARMLGFDMMNEPARRAAMDLSRDSGRAALSAKVALLEEFGQPPQAGFLLFLPAYENVALPPTVDERRRTLRGFVYTPFRAADFFDGVQKVTPSGVQFEVYDGAEAREQDLLYRSWSPAEPLGRASRTLNSYIAGRDWTLRVYERGPLSPTVSAPAVIAGGGAAITVLLGLLVWMLALSRQRLHERFDADRALAEQERRHKLALEQRVAERTVQLESANRELSTANRDLEAFAYSISHDLRAPLRAIDGHVARLIAESGSLDQPQQHHAAAVRRNIRQMTQLIDDLLRFALVSRRTLERRRVNLWELVQSIVEDLAVSEPVQFVADAQQLADVCADPALLRQALANLLENAVKFSRDSRPPRIEMGSEDSPEGRVFYVRDYGVGFDMRYAEKLFGVFERMHPSGEFEGAGMGLAIVKQIIERHGGRIWARSEPGAGATFHFTLGGDPGCGSHPGGESK